DAWQPASVPPGSDVPVAAAPFVALAFKLEDGTLGQLAYTRVYQDSLKKGQFIFHEHLGKRFKMPKLVCIYSNKIDNIGEITSSEICAIFGV
ncbi:hypothetical protein BJV78DRAFT_1102969, partial [Lactifluus subvellereus]